MGDSRPSTPAWPGDRVSTAHDAEVAHRPLDNSLSASLSQAIQREGGVTGYVDYLKKGDSNPLSNAEISDRLLSWPHCVFTSVHDAMSEDDLVGDITEMIQLCQDKFTSIAPFLRHIPNEIFFRQPRPQYLSLAMACMGAMMTNRPSKKISGLWWASLRSIFIKLEIDDRAASRLELMEAWVLLETVGILSCDWETWKCTSVLYGYVEAGVWRLLEELKEPELDSTLASGSPIGVSRCLLSYFAMVDLFRSIHFGQCSNLGSARFYSTSKEPDSSISTAGQPSSTLEGSFLHTIDKSYQPMHQLFTLLAQVHAISIILDPILSSPTARRKRAGVRAAHVYVPLAASNEITEVRVRVTQGFDKWRDDHLDDSTSGMALLYHFGRMYLLLPSMQKLIQLCEYPPWRTSSTDAATATTTEEITEDLESGAAVDHAWQILELASSTASLADSVWTPVALFLASLVVWASISLRRGRGAVASPKVLEAFRSELAMIKAPCCDKMCQTLKSLQSKKLKGKDSH